MILDDDGLSCDAGGLLEQPHRVVGVMQHVDQENDVDGQVVHRQGEPVELLHRDMRPGRTSTSMPVSARSGRWLPDRPPEQAVAAAHVEHRRTARQQRCDVARQHPDAAPEDEVRMEPADEAHRRRSPRMLKKKLESTVCTPSVTRIVPGITQRIVWA